MWCEPTEKINASKKIGRKKLIKYEVNEKKKILFKANKGDLLINKIRFF